METSSCRKTVVNPKRCGVSQLRNLDLCFRCLVRQGFDRKLASRSSAPDDSCALCHGLLSRLDRISEATVDLLREYEFESFLVGAKLPQTVLDREDEIRARLKIRGRRNLKTEVSHALGRTIEYKTGKRIDYKFPDLTVLCSMSDNSVEIAPRSIWIAARYNKNARGLPQRTSSCETCNGIGCARCGYKGATAESVQSIISTELARTFGGNGCNFIWVGSEDENSLVKGNGRPFFAEVLNPRKRRIRVDDLHNGHCASLGDTVGASGKEAAITIRDMEVLSHRPRSVPKFYMRCVVHLMGKETRGEAEATPDPIRKEDLQSRFTNATVEIRNPRKSHVIRKIVRSVRLVQESPGEDASIEIDCEGGIPIRRLVSSEDDSVVPNLTPYFKGYSISSEKPFDVLEISVALAYGITGGGVTGNRRRARHRTSFERRSKLDTQTKSSTHQLDDD